MKTQNSTPNNLTNMQKKAIEQLHEMYKKSKNNQKTSFDNQAKHFKSTTESTIKKPPTKSKKLIFYQIFLIPFSKIRISH